jgi:outer membrane protein assembly factor BamB
VGDGRIFLSGGYNAGSMLLAIKKDGGKLKAEPVFRLPPKVFGAAQQTPVFYGGLLYGVRPDGELTCLDLGGKAVWSSGPEHRFGLGPLLIAGGLIYVLNDSGLLVAVEATPEGYKPLARAQVLTGHDAWGPMAFVGGRLIARDLTRMVCLDVSAPPDNPRK